MNSSIDALRKEEQELQANLHNKCCRRSHLEHKINCERCKLKPDSSSLSQLREELRKLVAQIKALLERLTEIRAQLAAS